MERKSGADESWGLMEDDMICREKFEKNVIEKKRTERMKGREERPESDFLS